MRLFSSTHHERHIWHPYMDDDTAGVALVGFALLVITTIAVYLNSAFLV